MYYYEKEKEKYVNLRSTPNTNYAKFAKLSKWTISISL